MHFSSSEWHRRIEFARSKHPVIILVVTSARGQLYLYQRWGIVTVWLRPSMWRVYSGGLWQYMYCTPLACFMHGTAATLWPGIGWTILPSSSLVSTHDVWPLIGQDSGTGHWLWLWHWLRAGWWEVWTWECHIQLQETKSLREKYPLLINLIIILNKCAILHDDDA